MAHVRAVWDVAHKPELLIVVRLLCSYITEEQPETLSAKCNHMNFLIPLILSSIAISISWSAIVSTIFLEILNKS